MMKPAAVFAAALFPAAVAFAAPGDTFYKAGLEQTFGSDSYRGTYGWADIGADLHFKPAFEVFRSNASNGTFKALSVSAIYDTPDWEASGLAGGTLKTNGYSNRVFGLEGLRKFAPGLAPWGQDYGGAYGGAGLTHTTHTDEFQATAAARGRMGRGAVVERTSAASLGQTELRLLGGATLEDAVALSAVLSQSFYSRDLDSLSAREAQVLSLSGMDAVVSGFPNASVNLRAELTSLEGASPYVSYTRTTFKLGDPASNAYVVGSYLRRWSVEFKLAYELYKQAGVAGQNYFTAGVSATF